MAEGRGSQELLSGGPETNSVALCLSPAVWNRSGDSRGYVVTQNGRRSLGAIRCHVGRGARRARPMGYRIRAEPHADDPRPPAGPGRDQVFCRRPYTSTPQLTTRIRTEPASEAVFTLPLGSGAPSGRPEARRPASPRRARG